MSEPYAFKPWLFQVSPYPGESFAHFLGRFRRANSLSYQGLAKRLETKSALVRDWETPSRQRPPSAAQLALLSELVGIKSEQLAQMLPPESSQICFPTRLCSACYAEVPAHQGAWQRADTEECARHRIKLLLACPSCGKGFRLPALWEDGCCDRCWLPFSQMESKRAPSSQIVVELEVD